MRERERVEREERGMKGRKRDIEKEGDERERKKGERDR